MLATKFQPVQSAVLERYWYVQPSEQLQTPMQFPMTVSLLCVHSQVRTTADAGKEMLMNTVATRK